MGWPHSIQWTDRNNPKRKKQSADRQRIWWIGTTWTNSERYNGLGWTRCKSKENRLRIIAADTSISSSTVAVAVAQLAQRKDQRGQDGRWINEARINNDDGGDCTRSNGWTAATWKGRSVRLIDKGYDELAMLQRTQREMQWTWMDSMEIKGK